MVNYSRREKRTHFPASKLGTSCATQGPGRNERSKTMNKQTSILARIPGWFKYAFAFLVMAVLALGATSAQAQSNVTDIVDGASTVFTAVATLCVTIGVFFVGYRLAKRVR